MQNRWLDSFSIFIGRFVPDAITASVLLLIILAVSALLLGNAPTQVMDAYYRGLWMLLSFTMQMTLIILLSTALGATPFFRNAIQFLSRIPKTTNQFVILAILVSGFAAYCYWGLGIAISPIIAVYFAREAERRDVPLDFPFLLAVTWAINAVWQYGLSASAPLLVATPGHFLQNIIGIVPLSATIWSPASIIHEAAYTLAVIAAGCWLMPKTCRPISHFPASAKLAEPVSSVEPGEMSHSERLERKPLFAYILCAVLAAWLYFHFIVKGASLDINSLNTTLLLLTLLLHRNFKNFTGALEKAAVSSWPVIVLYHLYAGVAGLIQFTTVGERMANLTASISTPLTFPVLTAALGSLFAFFIPSSGGQWAIQGFVTVKAAMAVGISVPRGILAMSIGDHMGNLTSPFWYVVIAGIVQIDFRTFFGYGLLFAAIWFTVGSIVFTFAPC